MPRELQPATIPIIINCRDRVTPLRLLLDWLVRAGQEQVYLVDNASTYPPLLALYETTHHPVIRLGENVGHLAPWRAGIVNRVAGDGPYVVSDPDVVPVEECPLDAVGRFLDVLQRYPERVKVGFGLKLDDVPDCFRLKKSVLAWEKRFWMRPLGETGLYEAAIDTTFAVYRGGTAFALEPAIRTGPPYVARHLAWYVDSDNLDEEERYYRRYASPEITWWSHEVLPTWIDQAIDPEPDLQAIEALIPEGVSFILVDEDQWATGGTVRGRRAFPLLERDGQYWGRPSESDTAIREFERLRAAGARFAVIAWPAFWWLDHYAAFGEHLHMRYRCILRSDRLMVFDLHA